MKGKFSGGGDLYFNGVGASDHPHLHSRIGNARMVRADRRDIRLAVTMGAWSDGQQCHGGGGRTHIGDAEVRDPNWERNGPQVNNAVIDEYLWIMDYFTSG